MVMTSAMILQAVTMPQPWMVVIADTSLDLSPITATSLDMLYICSSTNSNLARRLLILSASIVSFSLKSVRNNFSYERIRGIAKYLTIFLSPDFFVVVKDMCRKMRSLSKSKNSFNQCHFPKRGQIICSKKLKFLSTTKSTLREIGPAPRRRTDKKKQKN